VIKQTLPGFTGAPGSSKESVHVRPKHCAGVIEGKERIEAKFL